MYFNYFHYFTRGRNINFNFVILFAKLFNYILPYDINAVLIKFILVY